MDSSQNFYFALETGLSTPSQYLIVKINGTNGSILWSITLSSWYSPITMGVSPGTTQLYILSSNPYFIILNAGNGAFISNINLFSIDMINGIAFSPNSAYYVLGTSHTMAGWNVYNLPTQTLINGFYGSFGVHEHAFQFQFINTSTYVMLSTQWGFSPNYETLISINATATNSNWQL